jgi:hypothetical protein
LEKKIEVGQKIMIDFGSVLLTVRGFEDEDEFEMTMKKMD